MFVDTYPDTSRTGELRDAFLAARKRGDEVYANALVRAFGQEVERITDLLILGALAPELPVVTLG